ncbi:MAG TPA: hypothetical protein DCZ73_02830 [Bacteroides sp.]|nr:hypothetical protein [Bacteroides sp.]
MKKLFRLTSLALLFGAGCLFGLSGCSDDNGDSFKELAFELDTEAVGDGTAPVLLPSGKTFAIPYHADGATAIEAAAATNGWQVSVDEANSQIVVTAPEADAEGGKTFTLKLTATGSGNQSITTEGIDFYHLTFDDPEGTFILNEGNMTTENGSLTYITPEGYIVDDAYKLVNGTEMGNVTQDMCFHDGKIYIISQNGATNPEGSSFENDGMLIVADAKTLQKVKSFDKEELPGLDWPTHIAVIDEQHVYIRDNAGVWHLNMDDMSLTFVNGSTKAPKNQFTVINGEIYFPMNGLLASLKKIDPATDQVSSVANMAFWSASTMINYFLGIAPSDDGNLWIVGTSDSKGGQNGEISLSKLDLATETLTQNMLSAQPNGVYGRCFAAHGNTIYYSSDTSIFRANFDPEAQGGFVDEMLFDLYDLDDNARMTYNGLGVHPITGHVFINTLKGFGNDFRTNAIWEFDFDTSMEEPVRKFENYLNFPAGVYFNTQQ